MIKVLFFAKLREQLGTGQLQVDWRQRCGDLASLKRLLIELNGPAWEGALLADNVVQAVNQEVVNDDHALCDGDEVAFFPPVTGG